MKVYHTVYLQAKLRIGNAILKPVHNYKCARQHIHNVTIGNEHFKNGNEHLYCRSSRKSLIMKKSRAECTNDN